MLLAQCKLFYVKEFLITNHSRAFCNAIYTGKIVTFLGVYFTRLCFKLNNLTGQKFGTSKLKLSWPVTLTCEPPAVISRSATANYCLTTASGTVLNCCSQFADHHFITQIMYLILSLTFFCFIMKNSNPAPVPRRH